MKNTKKINHLMTAAIRAIAVLAIAFAASSKAQDQEVQSYTGILNDVPVIVLMVWDDPSSLGQIYGELLISGESIEFGGVNPEQGRMILRDGQDNTYELTKSLTSDKIIWTGTVNRDIPFQFSRSR